MEEEEIKVGPEGNPHGEPTVGHGQHKQHPLLGLLPARGREGGSRRDHPGRRDCLSWTHRTPQGWFVLDVAAAMDSLSPMQSDRKSVV